MASPSPSGETNGHNLTEPLNVCKNASTSASEIDTIVGENSSRSLIILVWRRMLRLLTIASQDMTSMVSPFLDLPPELRQKILGKVVSFCNIDGTTAEAMVQLPGDPVAKFETLKETNMLSGKNKKEYAKLRPFFGICSTIRKDMEFVEREWLRNRTMNLGDVEHWLENRTDMDTIALSINSESFLHSPPPGYEDLVEEHNFETQTRDIASRPLDRAYYKRWATAIRRLPLGHFIYIELHDLQEADGRGMVDNVADRFQTYLMFRTKSRKLSAVVIVADPMPNRGYHSPRH